MENIRKDLKALRKGFRQLCKPDADMSEFQPDVALYMVKKSQKDLKRIEKELQRLSEYDKRFPDGLNNWIETYHEVVAFIHGRKHADDSVITQTKHEHGTTGLYNLAEEWTREYETLYAGKDWDAEEKETWWDNIEKFLTEKNKG